MPFPCFLSYTHAKQLNRDFPSKLELNIEYDLLVDGVVVQRDLSARVQSDIANGLTPYSNQIMKIKGGDNTIKDNMTLNFFAA